MKVSRQSQSPGLEIRFQGSRSAGEKPGRQESRVEREEGGRGAKQLSAQVLDVRAGLERVREALRTRLSIDGEDRGNARTAGHGRSEPPAHGLGKQGKAPEPRPVDTPLAPPQVNLRPPTPAAPDPTPAGPTGPAGSPPAAAGPAPPVVTPPPPQPPETPLDVNGVIDSPPQPPAAPPVEATEVPEAPEAPGVPEVPGVPGVPEAPAPEATSRAEGPEGGMAQEPVNLNGLVDASIEAEFFQFADALNRLFSSETRQLLDEYAPGSLDEIRSAIADAFEQVDERGDDLVLRSEYGIQFAYSADASVGVLEVDLERFTSASLHDAEGLSTFLLGAEHLDGAAPEGLLNVLDLALTTSTSSLTQDSGVPGSIVDMIA